ncbi:GLPGLI family protein [Zhouia sp. PK063]|uniref:GLPGLI family protein n=1 Tax=Zhouia sp. PK063 TaxID=3373602 RepID=UPI0037A27128
MLYKSKITFLILVYLFLIQTGYSQKIKDKFTYKAVYQLTYKLDSLHLENVKQEDMVLYLSNNVSSFCSKAKLIKNNVVVHGNEAHTAPAALTDFQYVIIKDHKKGTLAYTQQIVEDFFYYPQKLELCNWNILNDKKMISGYMAQKATTTFAGRDYIAWFTTEIPISDGPYKFNGLPGLIIEIADTENQYVFKLKSFEKLHPEVSFNINFKNYILTTKEKLQEVYLLYRSDSFTYVKNNMKANIRIEMPPETHKYYKERFAEELKKENNHIEKN